MLKPSSAEGQSYTVSMGEMPVDLITISQYHVSCYTIIQMLFGVAKYEFLHSQTFQTLYRDSN